MVYAVSRSDQPWWRSFQLMISIFIRSWYIWTTAQSQSVSITNRQYLVIFALVTMITLSISGATNVGTVKVYCDKTLQTNRPKYKHAYNSKDKCLGSSISLNKGDSFGEFRMGSTIVLIFEAPSSFNFKITPGQRVQMGESLGSFSIARHVDKVQSDRSSIIINAS